MSDQWGGNPNVRGANPDGSGGYVDPLADFAEFLFSRRGLMAVAGVDFFFNDGGMLSAGWEFGGEMIDGASSTIDAWTN